MNPNAKDPVTFTISVPHGKPAPTRRMVRRETP